MNSENPNSKNMTSFIFLFLCFVAVMIAIAIGLSWVSNLEYFNPTAEQIVEKRVKCVSANLLPNGATNVIELGNYWWQFELNGNKFMFYKSSRTSGNSYSAVTQVISQ